MKKFISVLIALTMLLSLAACSSSGEEKSTDKEAKKSSDSDYEIAVVVKVVGIDYFSVFEEGVKKFADEFGVNAYVTGPSSADAAEQVNILRI